MTAAGVCDGTLLEYCESGGNANQPYTFVHSIQCTYTNQTCKVTSGSAGCD